MCENIWNIPFWYHLAPVLMSLEGSCNSKSIVPRDILSLSSAFQKVLFYSPKVVVERKGLEGDVDRCGLFPCLPSVNPSPLFLEARMEKGLH